METHEAVAEKMEEMRPRFDRLADPTSAPRVVSSFNLFQTPEALADRMAGMFPTFGRTLEPSAGLGRLYRAIRHRSDCATVLVDSSPDCCRELYLATAGDESTRIVQADFLSHGAATLGRFDSIIMNPPFQMGTDVKHIRHALTMLAPGGRLVALCANGPRQRTHLQPLASQWIELPAGSFKAEGTSVNTVLLEILG